MTGRCSSGSIDDRYDPQDHGRRSDRRSSIAETCDELDPLAENLNAMLERIQALMYGLKEATDNIAMTSRPADQAAQPLRGGVAPGRGRIPAPRGAREHDRGIGRAPSSPSCAADDRAGGDPARARNKRRSSTRPRSRAEWASFTSCSPTTRASSWRSRRRRAAPVHGDRERVSEVLANLVDNAIKYGAPNGGGANGARPIVVKAMGEGDRICSRSPMAAAAFPRPIAVARSSASCGWSRAARSRAPGSGLARLGGRAPARRRAQARGQQPRPADRDLVAAGRSGAGAA